MTTNSDKPGPENLSDVYCSVGVDHLLIYCVQTILENEEECTLDRLVYECFTRFPQKFSLSTYPQWPDSTRVYRSWRRCILDNAWLTGSPQVGFKLTTKGSQAAKVASLKLETPNSEVKIKQTSKTRGKEEAVIKYLRNSPAFARWDNNSESFQLSESEFRNLLNATYETPRAVLIANLDYYMENAERVRDSKVISFLKACRNGNSKTLIEE